MRISTYRALAGAVVAVMTVITSSGCFQPAKECKDGTVAVEGYSEPGNLRIADDQDPSTPGIQRDVVATVVDNCGNKVALTSARLEFSRTEAGEWEDSRNASIEGDKATFKLVSFPVGLRYVRITLETERVGTVSRTLTFNTFDASARPEVATFKFAQDTNGDHTLNATELNDGEAPVAVLTFGNFEDGLPVEVKDEFSGTVYGTGTSANGGASVTLDQLPNLGSGDYHLVAKISSAEGLENKTQDPLNDDPLNAAAFVELKIDRDAPMLTLLAPSADIFGPKDDADTASEGFQLDISANVSTDAVEDVVIELSGLDPITVQRSGGSVLQRVTLPASGTTDYTLVVRTHDAAGNEFSVNHTFTVDYDPPTVDITSPLASAGPYDSFTQVLTANVTGAEGQTVHFFTQKSGTTMKVPLKDLVVTGGMVSDTATFPGGTQDIIAEIEDRAGNAATDTEASVAILGKGCSVQVTAPSGNPAILMSSNDTDPSTPQLLDFAVTGTSSNCANAPVDLLINDAPVATVNTDANGNFSILLPMPEGQATFRLSMTDQYGATNFVEVPVTVDLTAPAITYPGNNQSLTATVDLQELVAGAQQNFFFAPNPAPGTRVDVCANAILGSANTPCPDGSSGWYVLASNAVPVSGAFTYPDGVYSLKLVEVVDPAATGFNVSAPVAIKVDTVRPSVTSFAFVGDANNDNCLNLTESPSGSPSTQLVVSEAPVTVQLMDSTNNTAIGSPKPFTSTTGTISFSTGASSEVNLNLVAVVTDALGNKNVIANPTMANPINTAAFKSFRLDRANPTITLQSPTRTLLGIADDADVAASGYQLRIAAVTNTDVAANGVALSVTNASAPSTLTPTSSGSVSYDVTLAGAGTSSHTISLTPTDACGNVGSAVTTTVTADRDPPTIVLNSPKAANGPYGTYALQTSVGVTGASGQPVRVYTTVGTNSEVELQSLPAVSGGVSSGTVTYPDGTQTIRVEVADAAGNPASYSEPGVVVNGVGCSMLISSPTGSPALLNKSNDQTPASTTTWEGAVTGSTSNCAGQSATLYLATGASRTLLAGPVTADATGNFSFNISLADGSYVLEVEMNNGAGVLTQTQRNVVVDLSAPTLSNVSPSGSTLRFVAASNVHLIPTAQPGYVADGTPGGNAEVNVTLTVAGAQGGTAVVTYGGTTVGGPVSVTSDPQNLSIPTVLPHNTTGSFVVKVTDAGGNNVSQTSSAIVDVIAPAAPVVTQTVVSGQERAAKVSLVWAPTYDDGSTAGSGANQGYDIRWTTNAVTDTGITSDTDFFSPTLVKQEPVQAWSASNSTRILDVPPLAQYWISVRAFDEVGNYSVLSAPTPVVNFLSQGTLTNPSGVANVFYGYSMAGSASIDGDSIADLVVAAQTDGSGKVYVYNGGPNFLTAAPQTIVPPTSPAAPNNDNAAQNFGADVSVGKPSDTTGDLLISAPTWSRATGTPAYPANTGRVFLYFGGTNPIDTNTYVEFRGNAGSQLGRSAQIIKDINGDAYDDLVLAAPNDASNQGKVYVFFGRPKGDATTIGSWLYLQANNGGFVPMSEANIVIEGPTPVASGGNQFGRQRDGIAWLGNIDGSGPAEFLIPDSQDTLNKVFAFAGQTQTVSSAQRLLKTGALPTPNDALQTLSQGAAGTGARFGFGSCALGNANLTGGPASDLLVTNSRLNTAYLFADASAAGYGTTPVTITGASGTYFGFSCRTADFNGDGSADLAFGENVATNGNVWIFYRKAGASPFDSQTRSGFAQSKVKGAGASGVSFLMNDFTGDGKMDLVAGDNTDAPGKVNVWY